MKIGILELISDDVSRSPGRPVFDFFVTKQSASIMPQAVSVWCRRLGHDVVYAIYYGQKDPLALVPKDLDVIFISCFSRGSGLAYALARRLKMGNEKMLTILGGPHAKQFSLDALRFFDLVVKDCDEPLIKEILTDLPKDVIVSSHRQLKDIPTIEERLPEIRTASFWNKKPSRFSFVPILSSIGCPYSCDFCVDWNTSYQPLSLDRVKADLEFSARYLPEVKINFYDPNFGVNFEQVMSVIEGIEHPKKLWFLTEGSLKSLTEKRLFRMKEAGCLCVIPGIESWHSYSKKSGAANLGSAWEKLKAVADHFELIHRYIPIIQANLMFGLDTDMGDEPVILNKAFISKTPYVSHSINIPTPFGATPLFDTYLKDSRILKTLPFSFYAKPFLATTLRHYQPTEFYERLIHIFVHMTSMPLGYRAVRTTKNWMFKGYHPIRNLVLRQMISTMRQMLNLLKTDHSFRLFHEGKTTLLPEFYHQKFDRQLGPYAPLISRQERIPHLDTASQKAASVQLKQTGT